MENNKFFFFRSSCVAVNSKISDAPCTGENVYLAISPFSCGHFSLNGLVNNPYMEHLGNTVDGSEIR